MCNHDRLARLMLCLFCERALRGAFNLKQMYACRSTSTSEAPRAAAAAAAEGCKPKADDSSGGKQKIVWRAGASGVEGGAALTHYHSSRKL